MLQSENNNIPVEETFKDLQYFLDEDFNPQQTNFELTQPNIIPPENIAVLSVEEYNKVKEEHKGLLG
jgi:hypothetical protein